MARNTQASDPSRQRGNVLVIAAVSFAILAGFGALVVDLGFVSTVEAQLQTATDAGALAGARVLDGTEAGLVKARATAVEVAGRNDADGQAVILDPATDLDLGTWDPAARSFTISADPAQVNALRASTRRSDLTPFFARVAFQRDALGAAVQSIAVSGPRTGAGGVPWYLPFGLPNCLFDSFSEERLQDMTFVLSPPGLDNTGYAAIGDVTNASFLRAHFAAIGPCMEQWAADGTVEAECALAEVEDNVNLNNGTSDAVLQYIATHIGTDGIPWDSTLWGELPAQQAKSAVSPADYGSTYVGPIPVFQSGSSYCSGSGGSWNETAQIDFFVWAVLYDLVRSGGAASKTVYLRIDLDSIYEVGDWPGGGQDEHGVTSATPSYLVQ